MSEPELRADPLTGQWVIIAPGRALRPNAFSGEPREQREPVACPFCVGFESDTPDEVWALRPADSQPGDPSWQVRVVGNKYPAVVPYPGATACDEANACNDYVCHPARGRHEVLIESPRHVLSTSDLTEAELAAVLGAYQSRYAALGSEPGVQYVQIFKNMGAAAGASLEHAHSQIVALPLVPPQVQAELNGALAHYAKTGECFFCNLIQEELALGKRVVACTDDFVALCPYASRVPYELWILPRRHASQYHTGPISGQVAGLAQLLRNLVVALEQEHSRPAYNYVIHTAPFDTVPAVHYHWHIEVFPRLTKQAGFEWGTGCLINPVAPEVAAEKLRAVVRLLP